MRQKGIARLMVAAGAVMLAAAACSGVMAVRSFGDALGGRQERGAVATPVPLQAAMATPAGGVPAPGWQPALIGQTDEDRRAEEVAQRFVAAYASYDYRDPLGWQERVRSLMAAAAQGAVAGMADPARALRREVSRATLVETRSVQARGEQAQATLLVKVSRSVGGERAREVGQAYQVVLHREAGEWKVSAFSLLLEEYLDR